MSAHARLSEGGQRSGQRAAGRGDVFFSAERFLCAPPSSGLYSAHVFVAQMAWRGLPLLRGH